MFEIIPIKTRLIRPPQDDLYEVLDKFCPQLKEGDVFLVTSKVVSISQGRCLKKNEIQDKDKLIISESDAYIPRNKVPDNWVILTMKNNTIIPTAGIDESNADEHYILWPHEPAEEARKICIFLKKKFKLKKLAVIITDSHSIPLRYGVMGISIGFFGLKPLRVYSGSKDLFQRKLEVTKVNEADSLAAMGVYAMGEGNEMTPLAVIRGAKKLGFTNQRTYQDLLVPLEKDLYYPLTKNFKKK